MTGDWAEEKAREHECPGLSKAERDAYLDSGAEVARVHREQAERLAALLREVADRRPADLPLGGMCRDGHIEVHYSLSLMGDDERCPACKLRDSLLAEVRRVVAEESMRAVMGGESAGRCCDEILSRLEKL